MATRFLPLIAFIAVLAGCSSGPGRAPAIGEAFAGPATLTLRQELHPRSPVTATVKHGERMEVLQRRRRFFKVRTVRNEEGWTDGRHLLSTSEMAKLQRVAEQAKQAPSQGRATVYDALNIHTEPNRQSPSFEQIPEKGSVDVIGHRLAPRLPYDSPIMSLGAAAPVPARRKPKPKRQEETQPPPLPAPPPLPSNWRELSQTPYDPEALPRPPAKEVPAVPLEDWSLIRTMDGKVGWVLTRMLTMAIPDEVAQYAEGHRITSYFSLSEVRDDEEGAKHNWLWTTLSTTQRPYQFDGFRVFIWSLRRHRYETAYIERNVEGYYPVTVQPVETTDGRQKVTVPSFSLVLREKDGTLSRRTYAFFSPRVRLVNKVPWTRPEEGDSLARALAEKPLAAERLPQPDFTTRMKQKLAGWRDRLLRRN